MCWQYSAFRRYSVALSIGASHAQPLFANPQAGVGSSPTGVWTCAASTTPTGSDNEKKSLCQKGSNGRGYEVPNAALGGRNPRGALIRPEVREPFNITKDRGSVPPPGGPRGAVGKQASLAVLPLAKVRKPNWSRKLLALVVPLDGELMHTLRDVGN